jgi:hypothetical protein
MGRPPIGKHAMSGAERQRRYFAKLLDGKSSVTKPAKPDNAKDQEIAVLKARIRDLEAELARKGKSSVTKLSKHDGAARDTSSDHVRQLEADIRVLKEELARECSARRYAEAKAAPPDKQIAALEKKLIHYAVTIDGLRRDIERMHKERHLAAAEYNKLQMFYHADRKPTDAEKNEAFIILRKMKPYWAKEDETIPRPPPLPDKLYPEDVDARKRRKKEKDAEKKAAKS